MIKKIGITGGIGSGKSTVSSLLTIMNVPVYIADDESKKLVNSSPVIHAKLIESFGPDLFQEGVLNKVLFASLIFGKKSNLERANSIIHPVVLADFHHWLEQHFDYPVVAMETAILFESGFNRYVDFAVNISSPLELRIQRVQERDHVSREDVLTRISSQFSDEKKCSLSNLVILNDGHQALIPQVENLLSMINS